MSGRLPSFKNLSNYAARKAVRVFVCTMQGCERHYRGVERDGHWYGPEQCANCGGIQFETFHSEQEANTWASLRLQEDHGKISGLRRQVWYSLHAVGPDGLPVKVASYVADFVYRRDGVEIIADSKPDAGVDPVASLKLKWMAAMGKKVTILN